MKRPRNSRGGQQADDNKLWMHHECGCSANASAPPTGAAIVKPFAGGGIFDAGIISFCFSLRKNVPVGAYSHHDEGEAMMMSRTKTVFEKISERMIRTAELFGR